ncbi:MAG: CpaF family protein [Actinobacteria bacterium]|nr:CpaF family protein [Actinomycetota bacterium]MCL5072054.1 CpaF family protein [Actinomycetota bacterium]
MNFTINDNCNCLSEYIEKKIVKEIEVSELFKLQPSKRFVKIKNALKEIVNKEKILINDKELSKIMKEIYENTFEFGPISSLLRDDKVTEIMLNNWDDIYIEIDGMIKKTNIKFKNSQHVRNLIEKILSPLGLRADESMPMVDARLKNGSRINIVLNPVSLNESIMTIRKFKKNILEIDSLIELGTLSKEIADFIKTCVQCRLNIILSGATSTGKTTFLNILSNFISSLERVITIEETLELNLNLDHVVRLESRPPNLEGKGEITIRDLVRNSLRMRPDRMIVGEIRGVEAIDVLQAMNTGHDGSMTTVHANSPVDMISRLETMLLMSGINLNPSSARRIISSSIDLIIHLERQSNGQRVLSCLSEIIVPKKTIGSNTILDIKDIYVFQKEKSKNNLSYTGHIPGFINKIKKRSANFEFGNI